MLPASSVTPLTVRNTVIITMALAATVRWMRARSDLGMLPPLYGLPYIITWLAIDFKAHPGPQHDRGAPVTARRS